MLLLCLICSFLANLSAVSGNYEVQEKNCEARQETVVVTTTSVDFFHDQVTAYDLRFGSQTLDVTSVILVPTVLTETKTLTSFSGPEIVTSTSYVTATNYHTEYRTSFATAVATGTSRAFSTGVDVVDLTITQTAISVQTVTETRTVSDLVTAFSTVTATDHVSAFVTDTKVNPYYLTEISYQTVYHSVTSTVTNLADKTTEFTVTVTTHEYVTKCHEPKVSYDH